MSKNAPSGFHRLLLAGVAAIGCLYLQPAQAQQAYYLPQASSSQVTVNYGALSPYGGGVSPAVPGGFQPYGYTQGTRLSSAPKSVFTPFGQPAPVQGFPVPAYGYAAAPTVAPFVAPYANPAFAPGYAGNRTGLPASTPTSNGYPQSYLNVPGAQKYADAQPTKKKRKKKKATAPAAMPSSTPTATEEAAAAKVAAAEAVLESAPAATPAPAPAPEPQPAPAAAAPAEPIPAPTPPAEPESVPASVPSPAQNAPAATPAATASEQPAAESTGTETATTEAPAAEQQTASAEAPAETAPDTGGNAALPSGATRIVFEPGADELPQGATANLDALAEKMLADQNLKVQVLAYSGGTPDAESQARRKALARGLEVRKYLIGKGVRSNRIDVRALGTKSEGNPADRVDIVPSAG